MKTKSFILRGAVLAVVSFLPQLHAEPRVPLPALPSMALGLYHNRFDEAYWFGKERSETVQTEAGTLVESWSGYTLQRAGNNVSPFVVPAVGERGQLNVACDSGSVGFWFKPYWTSGAVKSGSEPGAAARLVDLVVIGSQDAAVGWSLQVSADGNALVLVGANGERVLGANIAWISGEWHWIVLNYGTKGTALYVDEAWVAEGDVTMALPAGYSGLVLGSSVLGGETAGGEFEDFYCYRKPMSASQPGFGYAGMKKRTLAGVVTAEEVAALAKRRAERKALMEAQALLEPEEEGGGGMMMRMMTPLSACVTNSPIYITNTTSEYVTNQGWTVTFDVQGTNGPVDIFTTTNFLSGTNTQWVWLENGPTCATYQYTNQPSARAFYILGTTNDTDSDGLTDAYEKLVSKTLVSTNDTDGDLMPDAWEVNNGLNPLVNDAGDDPDGDWLTNLQEYNGGTNSTDPRDVMVIVWGQNLYGQLNVPSGLRKAVGVTGGQKHSLALRADDTVMGWGGNTLGETNVPSGLSNVVAMASNGYDYPASTNPTAINLALKSNGTVVQWGTVSQAVPSNLSNVTAVAAGAFHALALRNDGSVVVWGETNIFAAQLPVGLTGVRSIAAGFIHTAAVLSNGTVAAWGINYPTIGYTMTNIPPGLSNVAMVSAKALHTVALRNNGTVVAWGYNQTGQTNVPAGLSNVITVAAGAGHSMALKQDGTVAVWGAVGAFPGLDQVSAIGAGWDHCLAVRSGRLLPFFVQQPVSKIELPGTPVTFTTLGLGLAGVKYQWQFNGVNLTGQTNASYTTTNSGNYTVVISTGAGSITSSVAGLTLISAPVITNTIPFAPSTNWITNAFGTIINLQVQATALATVQHPIRYQWFTNGIAITGATNFQYLRTTSWYPLWQTNPMDADYTVKVWNPVGTNQSAAWTVRVISLPKEGSTVAWGDNSDGQIEYPDLTNTLAIAAGEYHSVVVKEDGTLAQWGSYSADGIVTYPVGSPPSYTNLIAVAAGAEHDIGLKADGTVVSWGLSNAIANYVPTNLSGVKAVAAGWNHNLALLTNGTVTAWGYGNTSIGYTMTNVPAGLSNVTMIAAGGLHSVVLKSDGTVVSWGYNGSGETNVPSGLSNVVAVAAGGQHSLALKSDGTVTGWGYNNSGQCTPPTGLSNVMAIAAGWQHSAALKNDGTVVCWGATSSGQTNVPGTLPPVKMIAAGGDHTLAGVYSPLVQYPVDVSKDLLLIYNTNSVNSIVVKDYYLAHRPMVSGANVLGIGCTTNEVTTSAGLTNEILTSYWGWLSNNPTKHPQYVVCFLDIPSRVYDSTNVFPSVFVYIREATSGVRPFVTCINMETTNDCRAYIDKIRYFGTNYSPGKLVISASRGNYSNTNYYFDDALPGTLFCTNGVTGVLEAGGFQSSITYVPPSSYNQHIRNGTNVAGYVSWGANGSFVHTYAIDGTVTFRGESAWCLIQTVESWNGLRDNSGSLQSHFLDWFSPSAFGGTNYQNTAVGAVSHVHEPNLPGVNDPQLYFGLWQKGKTFSVCAWQSRITPYFQAVGDPLTAK